MIKPPVIVNESQRIDSSGDVTFFETVADAEGSLEPIDVENREYFAFDAAGRHLDLVVEGDRVKILVSEQNPTHAETLHKVLTDVFVRIGHTKKSCENASLDELIRKGTETFRYG